MGIFVIIKLYFPHKLESLISFLVQCKIQQIYFAFFNALMLNGTQTRNISLVPIENQIYLDSPKKVKFKLFCPKENRNIDWSVYLILCHHFTMGNGERWDFNCFSGSRVKILTTIGSV